MDSPPPPPGRCHCPRGGVSLIHPSVRVTASSLYPCSVLAAASVTHVMAFTGASPSAPSATTNPLLHLESKALEAGRDAVGKAWHRDGPGQGSNSRGQLGHLSDVGKRCPSGDGEVGRQAENWPPKKPELLCHRSVKEEHGHWCLCRT